MFSRVAPTILFVLLASDGHSARAQDFFERVFDGTASPIASFFGRGNSSRSVFSPYAYPGYRLGDGNDFMEAPGTYRTLCVRLCDGFYFPLSFSVRSGGLRRDAEQCAASCGEGARLFYHPNPGGDVETMTDLAGHAYSSLPTAFRFRKALVRGCRCRPQELTKADGAKEGGGGGPADDEVEHQDDQFTPYKSRNTEHVSVSGEARAVERPEPIDRQFHHLPPVAFPGVGRSPSVPVSRYIAPNRAD